MLSQHLPNHLKFPTHCAKSGGRVPPKLNCGLFHTFGCDIELSLRTMPLVQYLRVVIYISSIRSVHSKHLLLHHNILCGIELSLTGRGHCTHFARYGWWHGKDWYVMRLYHSLNISLLCMCDTLPMCVVLSQNECMWYYPICDTLPWCWVSRPICIVSDCQRSQSSHHPQSLSIRVK